MLFHNPQARSLPYPAELRTVMNVEAARQCRAWLSAWRGLAPGPTPLHEMQQLACRLGIARLSVKDESARSPLGSFKTLGAPVALIRHILRLYPGQGLDPARILSGDYARLLAGRTVISATDGNHGRALAAAARDAGCHCVIVLHAQVSAERSQAIAELGADIVRIEGNYDESVQTAARLAAENGWHVISDTSYEGYEEVPRDVMQGYGAIADEIWEQDAARAQGAPAYTHVFLQGGVGGLAAGIASYFWERLGADRPRLIVVEPEQADCLLQSAMAGHAARASGSVDSVMAGLACGEASPLAWRFLQESVDDFLTVTDQDAVAAMRLLAEGPDIPVVAGESGAAGLAGLLAVADRAPWRSALGLDDQASVLLINTEGATAPSVYEALAGQSAALVLQRQQRWRQERSVR